MKKTIEPIETTIAPVAIVEPVAPVAPVEQPIETTAQPVDTMPEEYKKVLDRLKKENKVVYIIEVEDLETDKTLYMFLKKPNFTILSAYLSIVERDSFLADKVLVEKCWLGGDEELTNFDDRVELFLSYRNKLGQMLKLSNSKIRNCNE